ncbi:hypothetical protein K438DRAFT_554794 [Mycena galopus ATCC 62051]|nr:hypothetical protein K438DRAFT_554794 [Mycena galopus ATCC 62051]
MLNYIISAHFGFPLSLFSAPHTSRRPHTARSDARTHRTPHTAMLVLSRLQDSLRAVLAPPALHTAILLTPAGQLVSFASHASRCKDEIRVIAGLSGEVWQETQEQGAGMVDSELGRIVVLPVDEPPPEMGPPASVVPEDYQPLMLLVLNSTDAMEWEELQMKVRDAPYPSCFHPLFAHTATVGKGTREPDC